jgi:hypothetical protein
MKKSQIKKKEMEKINSLNDKKVLLSILNLGAILNFHAWQHKFYFFTMKIIKKKVKQKFDIFDQLNKLCRVPVFVYFCIFASQIS